jgi:hypothetical protein
MSVFDTDTTTMEWIILGALILYLLALLRFFPELFVPRCPICGARLERRSDTAIFSLRNHWHLGWRRFSCLQCLYYYRRLVFFRGSEVKDEASALR